MRFVLGLDPGAHLGYCVMSFDGGNYSPVLYGTTDIDGVELKRALTFCQAQGENFVGIFYEG